MKQSLPARQRSLRDHNLGLALGLLASTDEPLSRARVAELTGLTRATASTLVEELVAGGLVQELTLPPTARSGRPATGIALAAGGLGGLGLEVNVDYLAATVVDLTGQPVRELVVEGDQRGAPPQDVLRAVTRLGKTASKGLRIAGTALALPGLLREGRLLLAPNLGWQDVAIRGAMTLDNEANFAALAEVTPRRRSFLHLSGEIGVGAGIVIDGALQRGTRGWSGEIGHLTVDPEGPPCHCGSRGCLEAYAGQEALARDVEGAARALGIALASALNLLDVGTVVLGGAYAAASAQLLPHVREELARRVLWADLEAPVVEVGSYGRRAAAVGAARSVVGRVLSDPTPWLVT